MDINILKNKLNQRASMVRGLLILTAGLLLSNVLLVALVYKAGFNKDINLNTIGLSKSIRITNHSVSASYIDQLAVLLVNQRLNVTPDNINAANASILLYVEPSYYASFKKQLDLDASTIKTQKISSAFYINDVKTDPVGMVAVVSGTLKRWVGDRMIGISHKKYDLKFSRNGYQLLLDSFVEVKKDKE